MRGLTLVFSLLALLGAGCSVITPIPPQPVIAGQSNEPRTVRLSEMCAEMGWKYESGPGAYQYTANGPRGDRMTFTIGKDVFSINGTRWRQECAAATCCCPKAPTTSWSSTSACTTWCATASRPVASNIRWTRLPRCRPATLKKTRPGL
jgi:hypothetical protein